LNPSARFWKRFAPTFIFALGFIVGNEGAYAAPLSTTFVLEDLNFQFPADQNGWPVSFDIPEPGVDGQFTWTYNSGDFANGTGKLIDLDLPITSFPLSEALLTVDLTGITGTNPGNFHNLTYDFALNFSPALSGPTSTANVTGNVDFTGTYLYFGGEWVGTVTSGTVHPVPTGDYNHNAVVDAADYTVWRESLGSTTNLAADGNGNGTIDSGDYDMWKANYGNHSGSAATGSGNAAVPEPMSLLMLLAGILAIFCRRRAAVS
jgi:hypothetical protein